MLENVKKNKVTLAVGAVGVCAICCLPILVPLVFAAVGGGAILMGQWVLVGLLALGAVWVVYRARAKTCEAEGSCGCGRT